MRRDNLPQTLVLLFLLLIVAVGLGLAGAVTYVGQTRTGQAQAATQAAEQKAQETGIVVVVISATPQPTGAPIEVVTATGQRPTLPPPSATEPTAPVVLELPPTLAPEPLATEPAPATEPPPSPLPQATAPVVSGSFGAPPIPGPSPTWSVFHFPTPFPASGPTKLSFHVTLNSGGVLDYVAAVQPPVIKGVDDIGFMAQVKAVSPNTITIGRYVVDQPNIGSGDPAERAIEFVNQWLPRYQEHAAYVDYWEGWNEVTYPNYEWYAGFEAARACEMQKHGFRAAIGAFSTGTPEPWQFEAFLPAIEAGIRCGAILTTHEYGAPTMYLWWSQGLPASMGHPEVPAYPDRGPLIGRYRYLYNDVLLPRGLVIPLVITEAGIDGGAGAGQRPGYGGQGWLGFQDYWRNELGVTDTTAFYIQQLAWYDSMLRQDSYVIGATIFNVSGGSSWQTFEASSIIPQLIEYAQSLNQAYVTRPPSSTTTWLARAVVGLGALILLAVSAATVGLAVLPSAPARLALPDPEFALHTPEGSPTPRPSPTTPPTATNEPIPLPTPHGFDFGTATPRPQPIFVATVTALPGIAEEPYHWHGSGSRLGLHVSRNSWPGIMQFVREARPSVMKGVDDVGFLGEVEQVSPNTVTVGRFVVDQPNPGQGDPVQRAEEFVQAYLPRYRANPAVDFWEGWNEPDPRHMDWYAQFEAHRACRMHELGLRAAIGGFSTGTPEMADFLRFLPAVRAAQQCGGILTLHEYGAPTFDLWFGSALPGHNAYPNRGVLAFRYRWWYEDVLIPNGLAIPLVVSEAGVDGLVAPGRREGPPGPGWLAFRDWWVSEGLTTDPDQFYIDQLAWYDGLAQQDSYMIGFTVYAAGGTDLPGQDTYEIGSILPDLTVYVRNNR